jgi:hemoglobin
MSQPDSRSLYERVGGEAAIMAAVDLFYRKVMADPLTRPFFDGLDMAAQVQKQISFMAWALGGPTEYRGKDLRAAHARLVKDKGLGDAHFNAVAGHLKATLEELGVDAPVIQEVMTAIAGTRTDVLDR